MASANRLATSVIEHALYVESRKAADEVERAESYVSQLNKTETREQIAGAGRRDSAQIDYLAAIDDILARYDFRRLSVRAEERRGALNAYVEAMRAAGRENELAIPEDVLASAARTPYKALAVEELRGVVATLKTWSTSPSDGTTFHQVALERARIAPACRRRLRRPYLHRPSCRCRARRRHPPP